MVRQLQQPQQYNFRPVGHARVSGKSEPVELFEVFDADLPAMREVKRAMMSGYPQALSLFRQRDWSVARAAFRTCCAQAPWDTVVGLYIKRCDAYLLQPPPSDWDGVAKVEKIN